MSCLAVYETGPLTEATTNSYAVPFYPATGGPNTYVVTITASASTADQAWAQAIEPQVQYLYQQTAITSHQIYNQSALYQTVDPCECEHAGTCLHCIAEQARLLRARRAAARAQAQRRKAQQRGRKLLLRLLNEAQQRQYADSKAFCVATADGVVFRLRKGKTAEELDDSGRCIRSYCIHLPYGYCDEDTLIAQKMMLESNPKMFAHVANITQHQRISAADERRYREEHMRECEAMLRAEGIENPREWDRQLRERYAVAEVEEVDNLIREIIEEAEEAA